ncbi:class I tRNA ligase family protein [Candidatus Jorgensenbacteria bacterium]|nr:class I tRNA ligase family protein [Candidatus Jorgensenbacteria bacterium]
MLRGLKQFSLPELEEKVLKFWREHGIFDKSLERRKGKRFKKFVFYEGPPTANGRPGIHHVLARAFKDIIPRYKTMRGFFVPRKGGWDTHGLPVELEVEKALGLKSKKDIEKFGIAPFNQKCKESVWRYKDEWERLTERIGFWLDLKNPYITYENEYIETLWHIFKQVYKRKLLYKGHKVVPWCTRCGTALSSHELALGYKEVTENSVYLKFKLKKGQKIGKFVIDDKTFVLSWTTTPWTLPGNVALAVGFDIEYSIVRIGEGRESSIYIIATGLIKVLDSNHIILGSVKGKNLVGLTYEPLFDIPVLHNKYSYKIYPADFVSTEDGTGVVHTAVMYGEDDYNLGKKIGLPEHHTVDEQGKFASDVSSLGGLYVKARETEEKILTHLRKDNTLLKTEEYTHEYPFCWRCDSPLIYYARNSWFIAMSKLKTSLIRANKDINWIPEHLKSGRFGSWLKEVKDWAISRERYWGTPLPIWQCTKNKHLEVIGSVDELKKRAVGKNTFLLFRHGESTSNVLDICGSHKDTPEFAFDLTEKGKKQVEAAARRLKTKKIDLIVSSPLIRTKKTAEIIKSFLGIKIVFDSELVDINPGIFYGRSVKEHHAFFKNDLQKFDTPPPEGESWNQTKRRMLGVIRKLNEEHEGKRILIVSHADPLWLLCGSFDGLTKEEQLKLRYPKNAELYGEIELKLPLDIDANLDLHRPYIDSVMLRCGECGSDMQRIPEVADVWFDSGAMPFAQNHWPFDVVKGKPPIQNKKINIDFPADYISEGVDQTRGWFYTLLAVSVLLGYGVSYRNVISLGLILDKNGQKMSKSKGNVVDPWAMINKYGADVVRWFFYTVNPPGEQKRFDEIDLNKVSRQFFSLLYNSFVFFDTYVHDKNLKFKKAVAKASNPLDVWVIARLHEIILTVTDRLDRYDVGGAARVIEEFVGDLSRWYIRRSRRRFQKPTSQKDYLDASQTLGHVLYNVSKLLAPFTPFFAETIHLSLFKDSVHIGDWPRADKKLIKKDGLDAMSLVRHIASLALGKRSEAGIKVRQPLLKLIVKDEKLKDYGDLLDILKDEVNVKEVVFDRGLVDEIKLDTNVTHDLKEEGWLREFVRVVQDLRQDAKLEPKDTIVLMVEVGDELHHVFTKHEAVLKREVNARIVEYRSSNKFDAELKTKLENWPVWVGLRKLV